MELSRFRMILGMAKMFQELESKQSHYQKAEYWYGFQRGIRRLHHGENFGTDQDHRQFMNCARGEYRKHLQDGYRSGYYFNGEIMEVIL